MLKDLSRGSYANSPSTDILTGIPDISEDARYAAGAFGQLMLRSAFQPILSVAEFGRMIGVEALLRATTPDNVVLSPWQVFEGITDEQVLLQLDRLCRSVHVENFLRQQGKGLLFVNIHPGILVGTRQTAGETFQQVLREYGVGTEHIVIEVLEGAIADESLLREAVGNYRARGFKVAIDDFGTGYSNFQRLWRLAPDIVKLDRSMIVEASENLKIRKVLPKLITIIHDVGSTVVVEGIETEQQAEIAVEAGADHLQGYFFARPASSIDLVQRTARENATRFTWRPTWNI